MLRALWSRWTREDAQRPYLHHSAMHRLRMTSYCGCVTGRNPMQRDCLAFAKPGFETVFATLAGPCLPRCRCQRLLGSSARCNAVHLVVTSAWRISWIWATGWPGEPRRGVHCIAVQEDRRVSRFRFPHRRGACALLPASGCLIRSMSGERELLRPVL